MMDFIMGIINAPGTLIGIISLLGVAGGVVALLRKAIAESVEAFKKIRWFIEKYKNLFTSGQGRVDYEAMVTEVDQALEAYAIVLNKVGLKKQAKLLRDLIPEKK